MPVGPSHGSRGGSSFSGGSSHSSGSNSSSSSNGSFFGALVGGIIGGALSQRRRQRFFSRYGYYPEDKDVQSLPKRNPPTFLLVLSIICAFICFVTFLIRSDTLETRDLISNRISIMETDWVEYKDLIDKASLNVDDDYYITTASFGSMKYTSYDDNPTAKGAYLDFQSNNISYYFIVYEYTDHEGNTFTGTTYTQFSASQVANLGGQIEIAYYSKSGAEHYSINTNYKLDSCQEYIEYKKLLTNYNNSAKNLMIAIIVEIVFVALFVTLYILKLRKYNKLIAQDDELLYQKKKAETDKAKAEAEVVQTEVASKNRFCKYCGCKIDPGSNVCSSCGAKLSKE